VDAHVQEREGVGRLAAGWCLALAVLASAATALAAPQEITITAPGGAAPDGRQIASYPAALDAIVAVMVRDLKLPVPRGKLIVYDTREEFELGLVEHLRIEPGLARETAKFAKAAVGSCNLLVNEAAIAVDAWPKRVELIAHELMHVVQLTLAKRCGLARPQWLIEASAEWVAYAVTAALKLDDLDEVRRRLAVRVREVARKDALPDLTRLDTFGQWVAARNRHGFDGTYGFSFLAADFLIARHSLARVADFFRRFDHADDPAANFSAAFGERVEEFERALAAHLRTILG
jgi:hypothetical protein